MEYPGTKNMIPMNARTKTEQKRIATMGGKASGEARRRKKTMRELAQMFGNLEVSNDKIRERMRSLGIKDEDMSHDTAVIIGQYMEAEKGNTQAASFIRDTRGENPRDPLLQLNVAEVKGVEITFKNCGKDKK